MIEYPLKDAKNQEIGTAQLSEAVFGRPVRSDLLHAVVNHQLGRRRSGTASVKRRSDVAGGGAKPYRQKGTGNARQGTIRAPHYRGGGVVFGPVARDYGGKVNKKVKRLALQTALSAKREAGELVLVDDLGLTEIKTKAMAALLATLGIQGSALIVLAEADAVVERSARNLPRISVIRFEGVNVYDLLAHDQVVTGSALKKLEERLA